MSGSNQGALRERSASDMNVVGKKQSMHKPKPLSGAAATASVRFSQNIENYDMTHAYNLPITPYTKGESPEEIKAKRTFLAGSTPHNNKDIIEDELSQSTQKLLQGYNNHDYTFNYPGMDANNHISPMPVNLVSLKSDTASIIDETNVPSPKLVVEKDLFGDKSYTASPTIDNLNHSTNASSDNTMMSAPKPSPRPNRATPLNDSPFSLASHTNQLSYTKSDNLDSSNLHSISQDKLLSTLFSASPSSPVDSRLDISELTVNCSTQVANYENRGNNNFEGKTNNDTNPYMNQLGLSASSTASSPAFSSSATPLSLTRGHNLNEKISEDLNQSRHSPVEKQTIISDFNSTPYYIKSSDDYSSVKPLIKAQSIKEVSKSIPPNSLYHNPGPVHNVAYNHSTNTTSVPRAHYTRAAAEKNLDIGVSFSNPPALGRLRGRDTKITSVCTNSYTSATHTSTTIVVNNVAKEEKVEVSVVVPDEVVVDTVSSIVKDVAVGPSTVDISIQCNENSILVSKNPCHNDAEFQVSPDSSFNSNDNWPSYRSQSNEIEEEKGLDELLSPASEIFVAPVKASARSSTNKAKAVLGADKEKDKLISKNKTKQVVAAAKLAQPKTVSAVTQHQSTIGKARPNKSVTAARRVLKSAHIESSIDSPSSVDTSSNEKQIRFYDDNFDDSNFVTSTLNETSAIDSASNHAVATVDSPNTFDVEDNKSIFSEVNTSINNVTFATTISIEDNSMANDDISFGSDGVEHINKYSAPKLVVGQRKVVKDNTFNSKSDDIKEITIVCDTGSSSTVMLTFGNQKDRKISMYPKAIQMRYDPTQPGNAHNQSRVLNSFQVSPQCLDIAPHGEKTMYLSFSPPSGYAGIYSGALKIISGKKSFVLLLRGEATDIKTENNWAPTAKVESRSSVANSDFDNNTNMQQFYPEISHSRNDLKPAARSEYQHQTARKSNEYLPYNSDVVDHRVVPDYSNYSHNLIPSKSNSYSGRPINNPENLDENVIAGYQGFNSFNNFSYKGNMRQYDSISSVDDIAYNRSSAHSYCDQMYPDFTENYSANQYVQHYSTRNVDDVPVSPPFFLAKRSSSDAPGRDEYPTQLDYSADPQMKFYGFDPYSVQYDYTQSNEYKSTANINTISPVQLPDNFERDYVNQRQRYVRDWLNKERNRIQDKESFTPKSILKSTSRVEDNKHYTYGADKFSCNDSSGLFFRRQNASFGTVSVGSLSRMKLELCNATENQIKIVIDDPKLPFVLLHNEINMQPRSYVRIPIRFVPVVKREFRTELVAKGENVGLMATIVITGSSM